MWNFLRKASAQLLIQRTCLNCPFFLFDEFGWLTLEAFLALEAAKMNCFAFICDFELSCVFV